MESSLSGLKRIYIEFEDNNKGVPVLVHAFEHVKEGLYHDLWHQNSFVKANQSCKNIYTKRKFLILQTLNRTKYACLRL